MGTSKEAGMKHGLVTLMWHFLNLVLGIKMSLVYNSLWLGDLTKLGLNPDAGTCELHGLGQDPDLCVSFLLNWRSLCLSYRL